MAHVFIAGMMGSGKTTIAKLLSDRLHVPCYDLDELVSQRMGRSVAEIFQLDGQARFREIEFATLLENLKSTNGIWALGGGTLTEPNALELLHEHGLLLYLSVPLKVLAKRIFGDVSRPLLKDSPTLEECTKRLSELLEERKETYRKCVVEIRFDGSESPETATDLVLHELSERRFVFHPTR